MNNLEKLALRHIARLADSINPHLPAYRLAKNWTDEECFKRDKEEAEKWTETSKAVREFKEWVSALSGG